MNNELLNKLYNNNNPIMYDLKDEFTKIIDLKEDDTNIEKWDKYRNYYVDRYSAYGIDCDASCLATNIYKIAYKFLNNASFMKQYEKISFDELNEYFISKNNVKIIPIQNIFEKENIKITYQREYKYQLSLGKYPSKEYYRGDTMTSFSNTHNHYKNNFSGNKDISNEIEKLAKNYQTIGNMIPVPTGFNMGRACNMANYDFGDLTMIKICEWYQHKESCKGCDYCDDALKKLLPNENSSIEYCKQWLDKFATWKEFVNENYLISYVDKDSYNPIVFWESHSYDNAELPTDEKSFFNYLKLLNECIENRNIEILNAILNSLIESYLARR